MGSFYEKFRTPKRGEFHFSLPFSSASEDAESKVDQFMQEWRKFQLDLETLEKNHEDYSNQFTSIQKMQRENLKAVTQQQKRIAYLKDTLKHLRENSDTDALSEIQDIVVEISECKNRLNDIALELPRENNGLYLSMILGGTLNLSLMSKNDKFRYKDDYEKFKITLSTISIVAFLMAYLFHLRVLDATANFILVGYYCTLTIRESILIVNGSRIKGWWLTHHYISALLSCISVTWPDGDCFQAFRSQFLVFCLYINVVQLLQCQYQRGALRRLRSLGQRHHMDITVDGFHSWMFKGLTFLLPFLVLGYVFELYNAYTLLKIWYTYKCDRQWQVLALSFLFLVVCLGNSWTTWQVCYRKFSTKDKVTARRRLQTKYSVANLQQMAEDTKQD